MPPRPRRRPVRNSASFATTGTEVSGPPRMCRATGQKWPPAPTTIGAANRSLSDPAIPGATDRRDRRVAEHARARAAEQEVVELAAANRVADGPRVAGFDRPPADHPGAEPGDLLERAAAGAVLRRRQVEERENIRGQPSGADLVAGKLRAIEDDARSSRRSRSLRAHDEPAGPPPTTMASQWVMPVWQA